MLKKEVSPRIVGLRKHESGKEAGVSGMQEAGTGAGGQERKRSTKIKSA